VSERQIALLRGINVGKAKRIAMSDLQVMCEKLGFTRVRTLLNSGNIVFDAKTAAEASAKKIEKGLITSLKVPARVTVLTAKELDAIVKGNPFAKVADNPSRYMVAVLNDPSDRAKLKEIAAADWGEDRVALGPRVAYVWCPNTILESLAFIAVGKALRDGVTTRNWATIEKLKALAASSSSQRIQVPRGD